MVKKTLYKRLSEFLVNLLTFLMGSVLVAVGAYGMEKDNMSATFLIWVGATMAASAVFGSALRMFEDEME